MRLRSRGWSDRQVLTLIGLMSQSVRALEAENERREEVLPRFCSNARRDEPYRRKS